MTSSLETQSALVFDSAGLAEFYQSLVELVEKYPLVFLKHLHGFLQQISTKVTYTTEPLEADMVVADFENLDLRDLIRFVDRGNVIAGLFLLFMLIVCVFFASSAGIIGGGGGSGTSTILQDDEEQRQPTRTPRPLLSAKKREKLGDIIGAFKGNPLSTPTGNRTNYSSYHHKEAGSTSDFNPYQPLKGFGDQLLKELEGFGQ